FRMVADVREIQLVQQQVRGLQLLVVTDDAILIEECPLRDAVRIGRARRPRGLFLCRTRDQSRRCASAWLLRPARLARNKGDTQNCEAATKGYDSHIHTNRISCHLCSAASAITF